MILRKINQAVVDYSTPRKGDSSRLLRFEPVQKDKNQDKESPTQEVKEGSTVTTYPKGLSLKIPYSRYQEVERIGSNKDLSKNSTEHEHSLETRTFTGGDSPTKSLGRNANDFNSSKMTFSAGSPPFKAISIKSILEFQTPALYGSADEKFTFEPVTHQLSAATADFEALQERNLNNQQNNLSSIPSKEIIIYDEAVDSRRGSFRPFRTSSITKFERPIPIIEDKASRDYDESQIQSQPNSHRVIEENTQPHAIAKGCIKSVHRPSGAFDLQTESPEINNENPPIKTKSLEDVQNVDQEIKNILDISSIKHGDGNFKFFFPSYLFF